MANTATLGIARQSGFGTANTTFTPIKIFDSVSPTLNINKIENAEMFGGLDTFAPEDGTRDAAISVEGNVYPQAIGYFLHMIAGNPTTTGATNYTHVYLPSESVPPRYTFGLDEPGGIDSYFKDVLLSSLSISQDVGDIAKFSAAGIASDQTIAAVTVDTAGVETRPFRFTDFTASLKIGEGSATAYTTFKNFTVSIDNPVSNIYSLAGATAASAQTQEFTGRRTVNFDGTLYFTNAQATALRGAFAANTNVELDLVWTVDVNTGLTISMPQMRVLDLAWTRGFGETELTFSGQAYYDATLEGSVEFTLLNQKASYTA